jgi:DNA-binding NarL/FixJ family response regulator
LAAMLSDRPHRPALEWDDAISKLENETVSGHLDADAVACVVSAAGGEIERRTTANADGLTDREVEVLSYIARGLTNREVGNALFISAKTVGRHVENIYMKAGVSTRAGAAIYAMEHGLVR